VAGYAYAGALPGGLKNIRESASPCVAARQPIAEELEAPLYDPETAEPVRAPGGACCIGRVCGRGPKPICLT